MPPIVPVILSGGSGTRLWPLSRTKRPKQFLPLTGPETLFQQTLLRLQQSSARRARPVVVCSDSHRFLVAEQLRQLETAPLAVVLEPEGRNTAPAAAVAALLAQAREGADSILLVLPADHAVLDTSSFVEALDRGVEAAKGGRLATFGVVPDRPETGYGYIRRGDDRGGWAELAEFVEKPDLATAQSYVRSGQYLWNSGMFVFRASAYLEELERFAPRMLGACRSALEGSESDRDFMRLGPGFLDCPADSIDYTVMEKTRNAAVVPLDAGWSDVGSWLALHDVLDKDASGNVIEGDVIMEGCSGSLLRSTGRLLAVIGIEDTVVIETSDAVLVMRKDQSQRLKSVVEGLDGTLR